MEEKGSSSQVKSEKKGKEADFGATQGADERQKCKKRIDAGEVLSKEFEDCKTKEPMQDGQDEKDGSKSKTKNKKSCHTKEPAAGLHDNTE